MLQTLRRCAPAGRQRSMAAKFECDGRTAAPSCPAPYGTRAATQLELRRHSRPQSSATNNRTDWLARGSQWADWDPNSETSAEIRALVESGNIVELETKLKGRLNFGTAGIRG